MRKLSRRAGIALALVLAAATLLGDVVEPTEDLGEHGVERHALVGPAHQRDPPDRPQLAHADRPHDGDAPHEPPDPLRRHGQTGRPQPLPERRPHDGQIHGQVRVLLHPATLRPRPRKNRGTGRA